MGVKAILLYVFFSIACVSIAATKNWTGNTNTSWNTGSNWSGGTLPANGDYLVIRPSNYTGAAASPLISANSSFGAGGISIEAAGVLTIQADISTSAIYVDAAGSAISMSSGTVSITGDFNISNDGVFSLSGGSLTQSGGGVNFSNGGIMNISSSGSFSTDASVFIYGKSGTGSSKLNISGGTFSMVSYVALDGVSTASSPSLNISGGTSTIQGINWDGDATDTPLLSISGGTLNLTGDIDHFTAAVPVLINISGGTLACSGAAFNMSKSVDRLTQTNGTIEMVSYWENAGEYNATGGTVIVANDMSLIKTGLWNFYNLTINSGKTFTQNEPNNINIAGSFTNNGGTFVEGTKSVTFNGIGTQTITNTLGETFYNLTLNCTGPINLSSGTDINVTNAFTTTSGVLNTSASDILTIGSAGSATAGIATSYVNGPMIHTIASSSANVVRTFPLGGSNGSRTLVLTVNHTNATSVKYTAEMVASSAEALGFTVPASCSHVSTMRYWQITRESVANLTDGKVQLYYDDNDGVTDMSNLRVVKSTGDVSPWIDIGGTGTANTTGSITSTTFSSFSKFTLGNANGGTNPLPIELIYFDAQLVNKKVDLSWSTASEQNNDYFIIEKTRDGVVYEFVLKLNGAGNSSSIINYNGLDQHPYEGVSYYRLKQVDMDGKFTYSKLVAVNLKTIEIVSIYPNPSSENSITYSIGSANDHEIIVSVIDEQGRVLVDQQEKIVQGINEKKLNVSMLANGSYFLKVILNEADYQKTEKIQKQFIVKKM